MGLFCARHGVLNPASGKGDAVSGITEIVLNSAGFQFGLHIHKLAMARRGSEKSGALNDLGRYSIVQETM